MLTPYHARSRTRTRAFESKYTQKLKKLEAAGGLFRWTSLGRCLFGTREIRPWESLCQSLQDTI